LCVLKARAFGMCDMLDPPWIAAAAVV